MREKTTVKKIRRSAAPTAGESASLDTLACDPKNPRTIVDASAAGLGASLRRIIPPPAGGIAIDKLGNLKL